MSKKLLVRCECSQNVVAAFRELGREAYSVDLQDSYGPYPQFHFKGDAISVFESGSWDFVIAHPPCTYLSRAGAHLLFPGGVLDPDRYNKGLAARAFANQWIYLLD